MIWIIFEISTGFILSVHHNEPTTQAGEDKAQTGASYLRLQNLNGFKWDGTNVVKCTEEEFEEREEGEKPVLILDEVNDKIKEKDFRDINYKSELRDGVKLHPVHSFKDDGFIEKTEFFKDYIDPTNKGTLIITIEETYTTHPDDAALDPTARRVKSRSKVRKWHTDASDKTKVHSKKKNTSKIYDTEEKQSREGERRRHHVVSVLRKNVAIAGIYSGHFSSYEDAVQKLIDLLGTHSESVSVFYQAGRGNIQTDIDSDSVNNWLSSTVQSTTETEAFVPHMVGMTYRNYIKEKLKGKIK